LQDGKRWRQLVEFRHSVGARALFPHHHHHVTREPAGLEGLGHLLLAVEDHGGSLDDMPLGRNGGNLDHRAAEIAMQHAQSAVGTEGVAGRAQHAVVATDGRRIAPLEPAAFQYGLAGVGVQVRAAHGSHIAMQQPGRQQFADQEAHSARRMEVVHVGLAIRIDARKQRHNRGEVAEVVPVDADSSGMRHGHQVQRVVGGATGGQQAHDGVDEAAFVDHFGDGQEVLAEGGL
jgi:hypothetical protein